MIKKIMLSLAEKAVKPDVKNLITDFTNSSANSVTIHHMAVLSSMSNWPGTIGCESGNLITGLIKTPSSQFSNAHYKAISNVSQELLKYTSLSNVQEIAFGSRFWRANLMSMQISSLHPYLFHLWDLIAYQENIFISGTVTFYDGPSLIKFRPKIYT